MTIAKQPASFAIRNRKSRVIQPNAMWLDQLSLDNRQATSVLVQRCSILGRVQFATETGRPSRFTAEWREESRGPFGDRQIHSGSNIGNGQVVSRQPVQKGWRQTHRKPRVTTRAVFVPFKHGRVDFSQATADRRRRLSGRAAQKHESNASMDRKNGPLVLESNERIDVAVRKQQSTESRAAVIGCQAGRQHQADAATGSSQRQRALEKQLIAIGMPVRLRVVHARVTCKSHDSCGFVARLRSTIAASVIGTDHVPRRIPDDGVKTGVGSSPSVRIEKDFRKFELPMEEPIPVRGGFGGLQKSIGLCAWKRAVTCENGIGECGEEARLQFRSKPASAPQVSHALPFRERALTVSESSERSFLRTYVFRRVVGVSGERKANRQDIAKGVADRLIVE